MYQIIFNKEMDKQGIVDVCKEAIALNDDVVIARNSTDVYVLRFGLRNSLPTNEFSTMLFGVDEDLEASSLSIFNAIYPFEDIAVGDRVDITVYDSFNVTADVLSVDLHGISVGNLDMDTLSLCYDGTSFVDSSDGIHIIDALDVASIVKVS